MKYKTMLLVILGIVIFLLGMTLANFYNISQKKDIVINSNFLCSCAALTGCEYVAKNVLYQLMKTEKDLYTCVDMYEILKEKCKR